MEPPILAAAYFILSHASIT